MSENREKRYNDVSDTFSQLKVFQAVRCVSLILPLTSPIDINQCQHQIVSPTPRHTITVASLSGTAFGPFDTWTTQNFKVSLSCLVQILCLRTSKVIIYKPSNNLLFFYFVYSDVSGRVCFAT